MQTGQTALSIAERLGYLSVVEMLRSVTAVSVPAPAASEEKYRVISPEIMQEAPMSDSEDEGGTTVRVVCFTIITQSVAPFYHNQLKTTCRENSVIMLIPHSFP